jgi:hypothetical protein
MMALTHHVIVHHAGLQAGLSNINYILLGDDIVIKGDELAKSYVKTLTDLGIEISEPKTLVSEHSFEFAKKFFHNGQDISPVPGWSLFLSNSSTELAGALVQIFKSFAFLPSPESISELIGIIIGNQPSRAKLLGKAHKIVPLLYYFPKDLETVTSENLSNFLKLVYPNYPCWSVAINHTVFRVLMTRTLTDKVITDVRDMMKKYDDTLSILRSFTIGSSDQDPLDTNLIPAVSVIKAESNRLSVMYEKLMSEWIWDTQNPLITDRLMISDPTKLVTDRAHLRMIGLVSVISQAIVKQGRDLVTDFPTIDPSAFQLEWDTLEAEVSNAH